MLTLLRALLGEETTHKQLPPSHERLRRPSTYGSHPNSGPLRLSGPAKERESKTSNSLASPVKKELVTCFIRTPKISGAQTTCTPSNQAKQVKRRIRPCIVAATRKQVLDTLKILKTLKLRQPTSQASTRQAPRTSRLTKSSQNLKAFLKSIACPSQARIKFFRFRFNFVSVHTLLPDTQHISANS
jgi:hypothetical protein